MFWALNSEFLGDRNARMKHKCFRKLIVDSEKPWLRKGRKERCWGRPGSWVKGETDNMH